MKNNVNKIILAPMEGVADVLMREILTSINHFDLCITEFVRVVDSLLPERVFYKMAPELENNGFTKSKTPIRVQLLGQDPVAMAENANRAIELGSHGIDINFGCPAKTVNKSRGGAVLLKTPQTIYDIVSAVKQATPKNTLVSAKIRLGFEDTSLLDEIVSAVTTANADQLTIHARTKIQGYRPPAYWHHIGVIQEKYPIELIANGEIWSLKNAQQCIKEAKTKNLMLGRGVLALPNLANVIKQTENVMSWVDVMELIHRYAQIELQGDKSYYFSSRIKQWLRYLKIQYPQAEQLFCNIKIMKNKNDILTALDAFSAHSTDAV